MRNRSTAPSSSARRPRPPPLWALVVEGAVALAMVLAGAFSGRLVLLVAGLPAFLISAFCLVVTVLSRRTPPPGA